MTYKEFKKWCKDNGWNILENEVSISVKNALGDIHVTIWKSSVDDIFINTIYMSLIEKALELAKTPLEERDGKKRL